MCSSKERSSEVRQALSTVRNQREKSRWYPAKEIFARKTKSDMKGILSGGETGTFSRKVPSGGIVVHVPSGGVEVHVERARRSPKSMVVSCLSREISQNKINQKNSSTGDADVVKE